MNLFGRSKASPDAAVSPASSAADLFAAGDTEDTPGTSPADADLPAGAAPDRTRPVMPPSGAPDDFVAEIDDYFVGDDATLDVTPGAPPKPPLYPPGFEPPPMPPPALESLKPLAPGAFLGGDLEVVEVLERGLINFYRADAGEWGSHEWQLVAERATETNEALEGPENALLTRARRFAQAGREYAVWPFGSRDPLDDWRPPANDDTFFRTARTLAEGLHALEAASLRADIGFDTVSVDEIGALHFYGFYEAGAAEDGIATLSALLGRIARKNLAPGATLRLDDELDSLPLSIEAKTFARQLAEGHFQSLSEVMAALEAFVPVTRTDLALACDVGQERELNEDSGFVLRLERAGHVLSAGLELMAVSDGMGGHEGGEIASDRTLAELQNALLKRLRLDWSDNRTARLAGQEILEEVNAGVVRMNEDPPYASLKNKPGATLVYALRFGSRLWLGNIGDSRAYRWNERAGLERLTKDHSYVQDLVDTGRLAEADAWDHPDGSIITSHIGMPRGGQKDVFLRWLAPGDKLFLVSDGVVDMLRDSTIKQIAAEAPDARTLANTLVAAANEAGGVDNITVAAMFCT